MSRRKAKPEQENPPAKLSATTEPPALDPMLGDKTPAFVEWLRDNDPAEFQRRYAGRRTHLGWHN